MAHFMMPCVTELAEAVREQGFVSSPRGLRTIELLGVSMQWSLGTYPIRIKMPKKLAGVEGVSLVAGQYNLDAITKAAPKVNQKMFEQSAAYGPAIAKQTEKVVNLLKREPSTRRAILYFGKVADVGTDKTTCLTSLQWILREGHLHAFLNQRSWDLSLGLSIDVVAVTTLSLAVARYLKVLPGFLYASAASLHIYDSAADRAFSDSPLYGRVTLNSSSNWGKWADVREEAQVALAEDPSAFVTVS